MIKGLLKPRGIRVFVPLLCVALSACDGALGDIDRLIREGYFAEAEEAARLRLELLDDAAPPPSDTVEVARVLDRLVLAMFRGGRGHLPEAIEHARRALRIKQTHLDEDDPDLARSLDNLGAMLSLRGDLDDALALHERALAIREATFGADSYEASLTLNYLGPLSYMMGDFAEASEYYRRALAIRTERLGPDHPRVAGVLNNLGILAYDMGDNEAARHHLERCLAIQERVRPDHPHVANVLNNLAYVHWRRGDYEEARRLGLRALDIKQRALPADDPDIADTLDLLGDIAHSQGRHEESLARYEGAIAIQQPSLGPDHPTVALSRYGLADTLRSLGRNDAAREQLEMATEIFASHLGETHPLTASGRRALATLLHDAGDIEGCLEAALRAEESGRRHLRLTSRAFAEGSGLRYASVRVSGLDLALTVAADAGAATAVEGIADAVIRSRALILDEMASRRRALTRASSVEIEPPRDRLDAARSRLANLMVRGVTGDPERHARRLERARERLEDAEAALARASAPFRQELALGAVGLEEVRAGLPEGGVLVAYARYRHHRAGEDDPLASYIALIVRRERQPIAVPLGGATRIDEAVSAWRERVSSHPLRHAGGERQADEEARLAGGRLRRAVWDPVARHLGDERLVFIVPDGALHTVSFAALPAAGETFLVESGPMLHYLSAERDLVLLEQPDVSGSGLLAMGDPDFSLAEAEVDRGTLRAGGGCADFDSIVFTRLPETLLEVVGIGEAWAGAVGNDVLVLTDAEARESRFKREAVGRRVIHLATHGFFVGGSCGADEGGTRSIGGLSGPDETAPPVSPDVNPLVLAGLAFAGANHRATAAPRQEDGILTAEEITSLDLEGVEWVVLSACDTGLGRIHEGEGVLGLRRAFQLAGARTLIMSLWSVDDSAARRWMEGLYAARFEGSSTAAAVRRATREYIDERRRRSESTHPFYWGAFVATGGWL